MKNLKKFETYFKEINEADKKEIDIPNLIGLLFQSRDISHIVHLSTGSYAGHKALNEYYDSIIDLIDELAEIYQGINGKVSIEIPSSKATDIIQYFDTLHNTLKKAKETIENDEILAKIDDILELISTTLYKLKELK